MDKNSRVTIVRGKKGNGVSGTIFWVGDNRYGPGKRFGVRGDDGETYWVAEDLVEETKAAAPPPKPEDPGVQKGATVTWTKGETVFMGRVFWYGKSKQGSGHRIGVEDDQGETHWLAANAVTPVEGEPVPPDRSRPSAPSSEAYEAAAPEEDDDPNPFAEPSPVGEPPAWMDDEPPVQEAPSWYEDEEPS